MVLCNMNLNLSVCDSRKQINVGCTFRNKIRNVDYFVIVSLSEAMQSPG